MNAVTPGSLVHYYDIRAHGILCGIRGTDQRSTKHARGVTCEACVGLLGNRLARPDEAAESNNATA